MLIKVLLVLAVLLLVFLVIVALQPARFRIERAATIAAPPAVVFERVNHLRQWQTWSPWEGKDPAMTRTYDGPPAGVGAAYGWSGNKEVGEGRMTVTESRPDELVRLKVEFIKPFAATNASEFTFTPEAGGRQTRVAWAMTGERNFMFKAACLFMDMDKLVGGDFERGLAAMKATAEAQAATAVAATN